MTQLPPPGWYPDPTVAPDHQQLRWWDGQQWGGQVVPATPSHGGGPDSPVSGSAADTPWGSQGYGAQEPSATQPDSGTDSGGGYRQWFGEQGWQGHGQAQQQSATDPFAQQYGNADPFGQHYGGHYGESASFGQRQEGADPFAQQSQGDPFAQRGHVDPAAQGYGNDPQWAHKGDDPFGQPYRGDAPFGHPYGASGPSSAGPSPYEADPGATWVGGYNEWAGHEGYAARHGGDFGAFQDHGYGMPVQPPTSTPGEEFTPGRDPGYGGYGTQGGYPRSGDTAIFTGPVGPAEPAGPVASAAPHGSSGQPGPGVPAGAPATTGGPGKGLIIGLALALVVVLGGGGGAYLMLMGGGQGDGTAQPVAGKPSVGTDAGASAGATRGGSTTGSVDTLAAGRTYKDPVAGITLKLPSKWKAQSQQSKQSQQEKKKSFVTGWATTGEYRCSLGKGPPKKCVKGTVASGRIGIPKKRVASTEVVAANILVTLGKKSYDVKKQQVRKAFKLQGSGKVRLGGRAAYHVRAKVDVPKSKLKPTIEVHMFKLNKRTWSWLYYSSDGVNGAPTMMEYHALLDSVTFRNPLKK